MTRPARTPALAVVRGWWLHRYRDPVRCRLLLVVTLTALASCSDGSGAVDHAEPPQAPTAPGSDTVFGDHGGVDPSEPVRYAEQPVDVPWPRDDWPEGALLDGVDPDELDALIDTAFVGDEVYESVRAVLVVHNGRMVVERYHPFDDAEVVFPTMGVSKAVTATLIGMAVTDGLLDVSEPTGLTEWRDDGRSAITIDHLLRMNSGLEWDESPGPESDAARMLESDHAAGYAIAKPLAEPVGSTFNYSSGSSAILIEILTRELGGSEQFSQFFDERLVTALDLETVRLALDGRQQFVGGVGFDTTARDLARIGLLHVRGGIWDGKRLLDWAWMDHVWTRSDTSPVYGAHWWLRGSPRSLVAQGLFGQYLVVTPELDLVIVVLSAPGGEPIPVVNRLLEVFSDALE